MLIILYTIILYYYCATIVLILYCITLDHYIIIALYHTQATLKKGYPKSDGVSNTKWNASGKINGNYYYHSRRSYIMCASSGGDPPSVDDDSAPSGSKSP